ncbi:MAG: YceI family protein [Bacteroidota bacterium]
MSRFLFLLVAGAALAVAPVRAQTMSVLTSESSITYDGTSPIHDWDATSRRVTGTLRLNASDPAQSSFVLQAPVASFDSGNRTRDRNMREATEADRFPNVRFSSGAIVVRSWSGSPGARQGRWRVSGSLTFSGVRRTVTVEVNAREERGRFIATGRFPISLSDFDVDRPGIGPVKIGDEIQLSFEVVGRLP